MMSSATNCHVMAGALMLLLLLNVISGNDAGYCTFPRYLWERPAKDTDRVWFSKTEYHRFTDTWDSQREVIVRETEMTVRHKVHASCSTGPAAPVSRRCFRKDILYKVICIAEEAGGKFRVQQRGNGKAVFTCLKFIRRNKSVVQLLSAVPKDVNEDRLCHDASLQRDEWPWIAPEQQAWEPCPFSGGFDFRFYEMLKHGRQKVCGKVWRSSRLESECIQGEGLRLSFPDSLCSPFYGEPAEVSLQCWGSWVEDTFRFIVLSAVGKQANLILRLPRHLPEDEVTAHLYFSPVTPISREGRPPGTVGALELRMTRSENGFCYDESPLCKEFRAKGKCTNTALHRIATYCKRSCGQCSNNKHYQKAECHFPAEFRGQWVQYSRNSKETLHIGLGNLQFSHLGQFYCKGKHWDEDLYKMVSVYENGCRPRYSCINMAREGDTVLKYRLSRSSPTDLSWRMCRFQDDPPPLLGAVHSAAPTALLPYSSRHLANCGLEGVAKVNITFSDGWSCSGMLSDWSSHQCHNMAKLTLKTNARCHRALSEEYLCTEHLYLDRHRALLITKHLTQDRYQCWTMFTEVDGADTRLVAYQSLSGACLLAVPPAGPALYRAAALVVQQIGGDIRQPCETYYSDEPDDAGEGRPPPPLNQLQDTKGQLNQLQDKSAGRKSDTRVRYTFDTQTARPGGREKNQRRDYQGAERKVVLMVKSSAPGRTVPLRITVLSLTILTVLNGITHR